MEATLYDDFEFKFYFGKCVWIQVPVICLCTSILIGFLPIDSFPLICYRYEKKCEAALVIIINENKLIKHNI